MAAVPRLRGEARPGRAAASADRDEEGFRLRLLLEDLQRAGGDACDEHGLVGRVDVARVGLARQQLAAPARLVEVRAVKDASAP